MTGKRVNLPFALLRHPLAILLSLGVAVAVGVLDKDLAQVLQPAGLIYFFLLQMTVIPVLVFAIVTSMARFVHLPGLSRLIIRVLVVFILIFTFVACVALATGLAGQPGKGLGAGTQEYLNSILRTSSQAADVSVSLAQKPGLSEKPEISEHRSLFDFVTRIVPRNIFESLSAGRVIQLVMFSVLFGVALGLLTGRPREFLLTVSENVLRTFKNVNKFLIYLFPAGSVCLLSYQIASMDTGALLPMMKFLLLLLTAVSVCFLINVLVIWIKSGESLRTVLSALVNPLAYAFISRSSLIALPYTLQALGEKLGYPDEEVNLIAPIGSILGRFGNTVFFVLGTLFVAQFYGVTLEPAHYGIIIFGSALAALGSSGKAAAASLMPGVGSIPMIALVFAPLGLPLDAFMVIFVAVGFLAEPFLVLFDVQTNIAAFILIARKTLPALEFEAARKRFRISIRASLVALLTALILMTGLVMIGLMYSGSRRSAYYLADSMIKEISARVEQRTLNYFLPAEKSARRLKFLLENNLVELDDREGLLTIMRDDVSVNPEFASVYFADLDGNFYMVKRMPDSSLSYRTITRTDSEVIVHWVHSNPENREGFRDSVDSLEEGYDPRKRGWYRDAVKANNLIWTDVYIFASDNMPGISCAIPISDVRGKLAGVISVDIGIAELSYFLGSLNISEQGKVFILNRKNKLIAFSVGQKAEIEALVQRGDQGGRTGTIDFVSADETPDELIRHSFLEYGKAEKKNEFFSFKGAGERFLSVYTSFAPNEYFNWTIGIILPEEQIMGYVNRTNSVVLLAAVVFVLAALGFGVSFSRAISEPLKRLARGMERIRNYDLTHTESIESSITEVGNMVKSFENMKKGLRAFNKYVPAKLVAQLIRLGKEPRIGGQTKRLTIFFSDIAGFTSISEGLTPEKLVDHMAVYFSYLSDTIIKNRGTVDKFIGDAIMAFWNAPMDVPDHGAAACYSALEFQQLLAALKKKYSDKGLSIFQAQTRIGIHTGKVIVGNMGSDERLNYTIIGDSVNLASRLEGLNKYYGTSIIISEETYREAADQIAARLLDRVAVKGKRQGIQIYELAGKRQNVEPVMDSFLSLATRSVESYFGREWKQAVDLIGQALDLKPKDPALGIILQRCEAFQENPPGRDWDGVFIHHEK